MQEWVAHHREHEGPIWQTANKINKRLQQETRERDRREMPRLTHLSDLQKLYVIVGAFLRKGAEQVELLEDDVFTDDEQQRLTNFGLRAERLSRDIQRLADPDVESDANGI